MSSANVVKLKKQGMPVDSVESARAWRAERQSIAKRKPEPVQVVVGETIIRAQHVQDDGSELPESHDQAKTRREIAEANLAELREGELSRELVRKADVERFTFAAFRALRDGLTNCSKRLGATVAVMTTPEECAAAIERDHRTLLQSWTKTMGREDAV